MPERDRTNQHELELDRQFRDNIARVAGHLRDLGVDLHEDESPEELVTMLEHVEQFELAVQNRGGDLMVDEPPHGGRAEPDDPHFVLPVRRSDERVAAYLLRLEDAAARMDERPLRGSARPGSAADVDFISGAHERARPYRHPVAPDGRTGAGGE